MNWLTRVFYPNCEERSETLGLVRTLARNMEHMMATLDELLADVQAESSVEDSIISLLKGIKAQLDAVLAGGLPPDQQVKVDAIFAAVEANKGKVQQAVTDNTPPAA